MEILFANLGNRNITYNNKVYSKQEIPSSFRDWTQDLLANYKKVSDKVKINIINPLIENKRFDNIYLLFSDQSNLNTRIDQDTIYTAKIIKKLLVDRHGYKEGQIQLSHINAKVIDNGNLIIEYRNLIRQVLRRDPTAFITICDAGGTAQQKMSLKIMAEYLLDESQYEVKYVEHNELVNDVNLNEYRKVIEEEQALKLIEHGEYEAAASLLSYKDLKKSADLKKKYKPQIYFSYVYFRYIQNERLAQLNAKRLKVEDDLTNFYIEGKPLCENESLVQFLGNKKAFRITELLLKALFLKQIKKYSLSILTFAQFYETFLEYIMVKMFPKEAYGKPRYRSPENKEKFDKYFKKNFMHFLSNNKAFQIDPDNLATRVMVGKASSNKSVKNICNTLSPFILYTDDCSVDNGRTINSIRNKIAHEGKYITNADLSHDLKYVPKLYEDIEAEMNLVDKNTYFTLNKNLCEFIRNPR